MKLYLSSYKFGNFTDELIKMVGANKRTAIIMNAVDYGDQARVPPKLEKQIAHFKTLGLEAEGLDLREYFGKEEELREKMQSYGLVWVNGGNSLILKRAFEQSGFDKILPELLKKDALVYAGFSAAIVVITPTMKGVKIVDDIITLPAGYADKIDLNGLGLIDFVVAMHYKSDHPESAAFDDYVAFCEKEKIPYKTLRDGEVITVIGSDVKIYTI